MSSATEVRGWAIRAAEARFAGRFDEAIEAARQALATDPADVETRIHLAHAALAHHDVRTAMEACREAMQREPMNPRAHHAAASALSAAGEEAMAERHLRIAIELDPDACALHVELGDLCRRLDRTDEARASYERALTLDRESIDARIGLVQVADDADVERARELLSRAPHDPAAVCAAARLLSSSGAADEVVGPLRELRGDATIAPHARCTVSFRLGDALDRLGQFDEAWAAYSEANALTPKVFDPDVHRAETARLCSVFDHPAEHDVPTVEGRARPVFIVGMPRSGTTLLERMLDSHPMIRGGGEMGLLRRAIGRIPTLTALKTPYPECAGELDHDGERALAEFLRDELDRAADGHGVVIDKTPDGARDLGLALRLLPDARVLWCRRDPLDTCLSCFQQQFRGAIPYAYDLEHLAVAYREHERLMTHWQRTVRVPILAVHYEMLVTNAELELREVLGFLELEWDEACLAFHQNPRRAQTASREQVRRPLYRSSIGRHRRYEKHLAPLVKALRAAD